MALPLLFSFLGGGLAKAGVLGAAGSFLANPLVASAIGSGIGTLAETGDPKKALLGGLGSFAGGSLMGNLMGGVAPGATSTNAISGPMTESLRPMPRPEGLGQAAASAAAPGARGIFDAGMNFAGSAQGIGSGIGGMLASGAMKRPQGMSAPDQSPRDFPEFELRPVEYRDPPPGYRPGFSPEHDYNVSNPFVRKYAPQGMAMGGFVDNPYAQNYAEERAEMIQTMAPAMPMAEGGELSFAKLMENNRRFRGRLGKDGSRLGSQSLAKRSTRAAPVEMEEGPAYTPAPPPDPTAFRLTSSQLNEMLGDRPLFMAQGGTVQRMVPGFGPVMMQAGGIAEMGAEPVPTEQPNEREVISGAISAIMGQHPQPEVVLGMFLQQYGEEALRDLVDRVQSGEFQDTQERFANGENGEVVGPGDGSGVDDMVPAVVDGQGDVLLSDGEFVLRKDATDALNSEFGPEFMDRMNSAGARAPEVVKQMVAA